jgi:putative ABC transport system permease protein
MKVDWRLASPGYFHAMEIPLVRGRDFTVADLATGAPPVIVVSQAMARRFWAGDDPVGRIVHRVGDRKDFTVIGVVGDVRMNALNQAAPSMYFPANARVLPLMDIVVRTESDPLLLLAAVRRKVKDLDPELPVFTVRTMESWVSNSAAQPRLNAVLLGIFAGVALLIAAVGIYGVLAYSVTQRTREIGLRMALGARRDDVLRLVVGQGMLVAAAGIAAGLLCGLAASRVLQSLLFGLSGRDPKTFAAVGVILATVSLVACALPAWRAARVDPMTALRED